MSSLDIRRKQPDDVVIALVGNPNVGKSTVFNALTGLNQHTGNWPGKTVDIAQGRYTYKGRGYILVDLPGTYSLLSQSEEERVAVEFILSGQADCTLVLGDATCLERNLHLALQVMELTDRMVLCVNLLDEAARQHLSVDLEKLSRQLGIPVVGTSAGSGQGLQALQEKLRNLADGFLVSHPRRILEDGAAFLSDWNQRESDRVSAAFGQRAEEIAAEALKGETGERAYKPDRYVLGKWTGRLILAGLLFLIFWLTMVGANVPSALLEKGFAWVEAWLRDLGASGILLDGVYVTVARVVSVMLPPMAIFFPLFTLLEDLGYLPRAAFLMDNSFQKCGSCGKQVLTMAMGFGCNAVGVMGCRIISSPKERLLAALTNAMVPCNGRFPALIALIALFFSDNSLMAAAMLTAMVLLGVGMTMLSTKLLSRTMLKKQPSHFVLELPPYRRPQIGKILLRSLLDRTAFVLGRALLVAAPAGVVLWLLQTYDLLLPLSQWLDPIGRFMGMNGVILLSFLLAFPANELLLPLVLMQAPNGFGDWTMQMALCTMVFILFHWPCGTTCLTIRKETGSWRWTLAAVLLPTAIGVILCSLLGSF